MAEKESAQQDSNEALGLYSKTPIKPGEGGAKGNEDGNQKPVNNPTPAANGFKFK